MIRHENQNSNKNKKTQKTVFKVCISRLSMLVILIAVMLATIAMLQINFMLGVYPRIKHSTYMYTEYSVQQKALRNKLYRLTPNNLKIICDTKLTEYEAATVITDYLLYDPYSYWLCPDYTLTISDGVLYLICKTDYTNEQRKQVDTEITERINKVVTDVEAQRDNGVKAMYTTIYEHLDDIELTDGTFRAPIRCCLIDRACNCQGLAYTFLYICEQVGLQAELQYGNYYGIKCVGWTVDNNAMRDGTYTMERSNAGHVWNAVNIEETTYYIDIYAQIDDDVKDLRFLTATEMKEHYYLWVENDTQLFTDTLDITENTFRLLILVVLLMLLQICCIMCLELPNVTEASENEKTEKYYRIV